MTSPIVSIVIPAYNAARYLQAAVDSVLAQDYPHVETIVIDDGSTDETASIARSYGGRIRFLSQSNAGQAATLNRGWSLSRGSILGYLAADDLLEPHAVSRSVDVLSHLPGAIVTYGDYSLISPRSAVLRRIRAPEFSRRALTERFEVAPGPGAFFRREAFERAGPWNARYRQTPDYDFWLRMAVAGEFVHIPEVLASFRVHPGSQSFAKPDADRAEEPVVIADAFFEAHPSERSSASRGRSAARIAAARAHLRAGRYGHSFRLLADALRISPRTVLHPRSLKMLLGGVGGRARYMLAWRIVHLFRIPSR